MDLKKIGITTLLCFIAIFLFYTNVGLNISGPLNYETYKNELVLKTVKNRFPTINKLYRHSFKYVTYSYYDEKNAYVFDNEGTLVVSKEFNLNMLDEIKQIVFKDYGIEDAKVHIGFGYHNIVFAVEEEKTMILFDYDTKEVVYYLKGDLV